MLQSVLNKSWRQHSTKQLYGHLAPITKTIQVRRTRHCWRNKDKLISDILLRSPSGGQKKIGLARTYIQQLCADTVCSLEDLPAAMDDGDVAREGQGDPFLQRDRMMMMMMMVIFIIKRNNVFQTSFSKIRSIQCRIKPKSNLFHLPQFVYDITSCFMQFLNIYEKQIAIIR